MNELPAEIGEFYTLIDEGDEEDRFYSIDHDVCATCKMVDYQTSMMTDLHPEIPIQWVCVGLIPYKDTPKDDHEGLIRIRMCLNANGVLICHEWTPLEAHRLGEILVNAAGIFLLKDQPGEMWSDIEELLTTKEDKT